MLIFFAITAWVGLAELVEGWGYDTHKTIGYLAERYLLNETVFSFYLISNKVENSSQRTFI